MGKPQTERALDFFPPLSMTMPHPTTVTPFDDSSAFSEELSDKVTLDSATSETSKCLIGDIPAV
jgi:hypothetical protein